MMGVTHTKIEFCFVPLAIRKLIKPPTGIRREFCFNGSASMKRLFKRHERLRVSEILKNWLRQLHACCRKIITSGSNSVQIQNWQGIIRIVQPFDSGYFKSFRRLFRTTIESFNCSRHINILFRRTTGPFVWHSFNMLQLLNKTHTTEWIRKPCRAFQTTSRCSSLN